jgi:intein/homing endonuclease
MVKINAELAELIGAHIGDGSMGFYQGHPVISFFGHPVEDKEYVISILKIYEKYFGIKANLRKWSGVIGFQFFSKDVFNFFKSLNIPVGPKYNAAIPLIIINSNDRILASFIRGIFDTDGTLYFERKNGKYYPRIQLKITSKNVAMQILKILNNNFGVTTTLYKRKEKTNWKVSYFVETRGVKNLATWMEKIGFRNIKNLSKLILWHRDLNPKLQFSSRINLIKNLGL